MGIRRQGQDLLFLAISGDRVLRQARRKQWLLNLRSAWGGKGVRNMRWVMHIGIRKTGTKAIQRFLANEAGRGPYAHLFFPIHGREGNWHEPLELALLEENGSELDNALAAHASHGECIGVFSSEGLYELPPRSIRIIREKLGETQIILFIRRQDYAMNSLLNQYAKSHKVPFNAVKNFERNIAEYNPRFDYCRIISNWAAVFGIEAITTIVADKRVDAVRQFCDAIGIEYTPSYRHLPNPNPALNRNAYEAFMRAKAVTETSELPALVSRLHREFASEMVDTSHREGPCLIDEGVSSRIMQNYAISNEYVRSHWFPHRSKLFEDCV
jgi:hypothetical protein